MNFREKLDSLLERAEKPIAIFDLDGTLFDVTYRTMEIVKRFARLPEMRARFPEQVATMAKLRYQDYLYSLDATLTNAGVDRYSEHSAHFLHAVETHWYRHFFTDELIAFDVPYSGALACVKHVRAAGAQIVYLSGRDIPNMSRGTIEALEKHGFPHSGHGIAMCLKPNYGQDDLLFKKQSIETISSQGEVVFTIDNEPANVQLFADRFPQAVNVHFHSHFAKTLPLAGASLLVAKTFDELGFRDA